MWGPHWSRSGPCLTSFYRNKCWAAVGEGKIRLLSLITSGIFFSSTGNLLKDSKNSALKSGTIAQILFILYITSYKGFIFHGNYGHNRANIKQLPLSTFFILETIKSSGVSQVMFKMLFSSECVACKCYSCMIENKRECQFWLNWGDAVAVRKIACLACRTVQIPCACRSPNTLGISW